MLYNCWKQFLWRWCLFWSLQCFYSPGLPWSTNPLVVKPEQLCILTLWWIHLPSLSPQNLFFNKLQLWFSFGNCQILSIKKWIWQNLCCRCIAGTVVNAVYGVLGAFLVHNFSRVFRLWTLKRLTNISEQCIRYLNAVSQYETCPGFSHCSLLFSSCVIRESLRSQHLSFRFFQPPTSDWNTLDCLIWES